MFIWTPYRCQKSGLAGNANEKLKESGARRRVPGSKRAEEIHMWLVPHPSGHTRSKHWHEPALFPPIMSPREARIVE